MLVGKLGLTALSCVLSAQFASAQEDPWDGWPFCSRSCASSASCDAPNRDCVCSQIYLGCVKFSTCNGADEKVAMSLIDPICGTVNGSTPFPAPPTTSDPTPTPTPTPTQPPSPSTNRPAPTQPNTTSSITSPSNSLSNTSSLSRSSRRSDSSGSQTELSSHPIQSTSLTSDNITQTSADLNAMATIIDSPSGTSKRKTIGPAVGVAIAVAAILIFISMFMLRRRYIQRTFIMNSKEQDSEADTPKQMVIPTPGLSPYSHRRTDIDTGEDLGSNMSKGVASHQKTHKAGEFNKARSSNEQPESSTRSSSAVDSGRDESTHASSSSPAPSTGNVPLTTTPGDTDARPQVLPPPYHLIPGNL